jgi:hypothetical protein
MATDESGIGPEAYIRIHPGNKVSRTHLERKKRYTC